MNFLSIPHQLYGMLLHCVIFLLEKLVTQDVFFATHGVKEIQSVNFNFIINVIIGCFISYEGGQPTMQCSHGWNIGQAPEGYYYYYNATTQGN